MRRWDKNTLWCWGLALLPLLVAAVAWFFLPGEVAVQWRVDEPLWHGGKWAVFVGPGVMLLVTFAFWALLDWLRFHAGLPPKVTRFLAGGRIVASALFAFIGCIFTVNIFLRI